MKVMETLTKLVVGMSRLGEHLLKRKVSGIIVAALAFACGAALVHSRKSEPRTTCAVVVPTMPADPARAEVSMRDTPRKEADEEEYGTRELQEWKNLHSGVALPLGYDSVPSWSKMSESKIVVLPSGRTLAAVGDALYMLGADKRVVWKYELSQPAIDFAYVEAMGVVCGTAYDNVMFILDASTGREMVSNFRNGRAGYGAVLKYGGDMCLIADALGGYNVDHRSGEPVMDGVTAWRGTRMLWHVDVPPDAELQVVGSKVYAVTKTKSRILVKEIKVPQR
jgi:hypothetical protein